VSTFASKKETPTTDEYLKADLGDVLDRLNKNPGELQSEEGFIHAVITVRNALIAEKLTKWLVFFTAVVAVATALLVCIPFFTPSLEAKNLESQIADVQAAYKRLQTENIALENEVVELKQALSVLNNQVQNITLNLGEKAE